MNGNSGKLKIRINRQTSIVACVFLTIGITNISQMSVFVDAGVSSRISITAWVVCFAAVLIGSKKILSKTTLPLLLCTLMFFAFTALNYLFTGLNYWSSAHIYSLFISLFIYITGCFLSDFIQKAEWNKIISAYVISSCIVAIEVFVNYFMHGFNISSRIYAYDSKNSLSQILLTAIILIIFGMDEDTKKKYRSINSVVIIGLFILICLMKSRATLIGFVVLLFSFMTQKSIKTKYKVALCILACVALVLILRNPVINNLVIDNILFAGRSATNLNDLTSGRVTLVENGIRQIRENLFLGIGSKYLDCYPVATILQFGLLPGIMLWIIAMIPLFTSFKYSKDRSSDYSLISVTLAVLSGTYLLNGLFEALTPLGPGVKCYLLWLVLGIVCNKHNYYIEHTEEGVSYGS